MRARLDPRRFHRTAARSASLVALVLVVLAMVTGCAPAPATPPPGELLLAYARDKNVTNDVLDEQPTGSPEDRVANIAAYFSRDQLAGFLLGAYPCGERPTATYSYRIRDLGCPVPPAVAEAADGAAGGQQVLVRGMIVRHPDGRLELMPLYVAGSGAGALLVDETGRAYAGGLDDFRGHNDLLSRDDQLLVAADPTDTSGGVMTVVTGSTAPPASMIVLGACAALAGLLLVIGVVRLVVRRRRLAG
jgi:hypothetical protein